MKDIVKRRCDWCGTDPDYVAYHDHEWGKLVKDDQKLFEYLILENAQAGLNWMTILKKRAGYRQAFCNFDVQAVARMTVADVDRLMQFPGIIRNRLKIKAAVTNARLFLDVQQEFGSFYQYILSFFPNQKPIVNHFQTIQEIPVSSPESDAISADMKKRGFKFFGTTLCYAYLQAAGFVDDHLVSCPCKQR